LTYRKTLDAKENRSIVAAPSDIAGFPDRENSRPSVPVFWYSSPTLHDFCFRITEAEAGIDDVLVVSRF